MATGPLEASDPFHALRRLKNDAAHRQVRWTLCASTIAMTGAHKHWLSSMLQQVIILSAIEEMVRERRPGVANDTMPTPSEYFAAIMTGLEAEDQSHTPEVGLKPGREAQSGESALSWDCI